MKIGNDDPQEVVFKELYRNARRLVNEARKSKSKDLSEVNAFLAKLENAEDQAIAIYEGRDDWYKFCSWFHRFFGGAFLGSHKDRLDGLQDKLAKKAKLDFTNFFKIYSLYFTSEAGMDVDVNGKQFRVEWKEGAVRIWDKAKPADVAIATLAGLKGISDDRGNFLKSADLLKDQYRSFIVKVGDKNYDVRVGYTIYDIIRIQDVNEKRKGTNKGLLEIRTADRYAIDFEGVRRDAIPEGVKHIFNAAVLQAYKDSSKYGYSGDIEISREGLDLIPEWHLNKFSSVPESFKVKHKDEQGTDAGGLKREYVAKLASSVSSREALFAEADGSLRIPRIVRGNGEAVLSCDGEEREIYESFGKLFSRCYRSQPTVHDP